MQKILEESYVTFVKQTFGPELIGFLTPDYKKLYFEAITDLWKKIKDMDIDENCDEFSELKLETLDTIPTPSVHRDSCYRVFENADEIVEETIRALYNSEL